MKNCFKVFFLLILPFISFSQRHVVTYSQQNSIGLLSKSYLQTSNISGKKDRIVKSISIIYNSQNCSFYVEDLGIIFFPIRSFSRRLEGDYIITSFVSREFKSKVDGFYGVIIQENKDRINFQVNLPNVTYFGDKILKYSVNRKVGKRDFVKNYNELLNLSKIEDSVSRKNQIEVLENSIKIRLEDSIYNVEKTNSHLISEEKKLMLGENYNSLNLRWLNDTIQTKVDIKENETFYNSFIVRINKEGIITKLEPDTLHSSGHIIYSYLPLINQVVLGRKVKPYTSPKNGNVYPSYSELYIGLYYDPNKKRKKKSLF